jgi:hypothetical protein
VPGVGEVVVRVVGVVGDDGSTMTGEPPAAAVGGTAAAGVPPAGGAAAGILPPVGGSAAGGEPPAGGAAAGGDAPAAGDPPTITASSGACQQQSFTCIALEQSWVCS